MTTDSNPDSETPERGKIRSAWHIWLHPSRSRREMETLQDEVATLQDLLGRTDRDRTRLIEEVNRKNEDIHRISEETHRDIEQFKFRLHELESEKKALSQEVGEWRQTRIELDALEEQLKEWEGIKTKYEERIKMLTLRLRDALGHRMPMRSSDLDSDILEEGENPYLTPEEREAMIKRKADADIASRILSDMFPDDRPIDMTAPAPGETPEVSDSGLSSPSSSWTSASTDLSATERYRTSRPTGKIPGHRHLPKDDTDWLITLPPE